MKFKMYHNGKKFVFEGEGMRVVDDNVHALMPKIKRLKIGRDDEHLPKVSNMGRRRRTVTQGGQ